MPIVASCLSSVPAPSALGAEVSTITPPSAIRLGSSRAATIASRLAWLGLGLGLGLG